VVCKFGEGVAVAIVATSILGYGLDFLLGFWLFFLGALSLEKGVLALVGYWSTIITIISVKVKVLGGGICSYGWLKILIYYPWKNEHIPLFLTLISRVFHWPVH
jgi:hypothetical protein